MGSLTLLNVPEGTLFAIEAQFKASEQGGVTAVPMIPVKESSFVVFQGNVKTLFLNFEFLFLIKLENWGFLFSRIR